MTRTRTILTRMALCLAFMACCSSLNAMPMTGDTLSHFFDRHFKYFLKRWQIPGATVAVMKKGKLLMARGYGYANLAQDKPMKPYDLFRIGSVSKLITAVATLKLVQDKKLALNDSVFDVLDHLKPLGYNKINPRLHQMTIRNLLQMSSGWYTHRPQDLDPMFGPWPLRVKNRLNWQIPPTCRMATRLMMSLGLHYRPGHQFSYSNINYCILGMVITQKVRNTLAPHKSYVPYVKSNILAPIGIYDMTIGSTQQALQHPREVTYYAYPPSNHDPTIGNNDGLPYSTSEILKKNAADGGWIASSIDLAKFMDALGRDKIINRHMIHILTHRPRFQKNKRHYFAMGLVVRKIHRHWYWIKTGSFTGTMALVIRRDDGKVYAALLNTEPAVKWRCFKQLRKLLLLL